MASQQIPVCTANPVKIALCQISVGTDKSENIKTASKAITEAAANADIIILPEIWNSPYDTASFPRYAEVIPDTAAELKQSENPSSLALSQLAEAVGNAANHKIFHASAVQCSGSIPERSGDAVYNTCVVYGPNGAILGKHRKVHLFDINIPGKQVFKESDTLSAGNSITVIETPLCKVSHIIAIALV
eukprot:19271-Heterococcus_DN1.PRE.4